MDLYFYKARAIAGLGNSGLYPSYWPMLVIDVAQMQLE